MVEHTLKDSKVEMAERVFQSGREKKRGRERDGADIEPHSLINPEKLRRVGTYFSGIQNRLPPLSFLSDTVCYCFSLILNWNAWF